VGTVPSIEDGDPFGFGGNPSNEPEPVDFKAASEGVPIIAGADWDLPSLSSDTEKVNAVLGGMVFPISEEHVKNFRLDLADLSIEEQVDLAREVHNAIGKASGYLPDFNSQTENMKAAYLKAVRDVWVAAQRKARTYHE
jgi:hypothetical protein